MDVVQPPPKERPIGLPGVAREAVGEFRRRRLSLPPGDTSFSVRRSLRMQREPLAFGLERYAMYGPIFTVRVFHRPIVFMLGPEANHFVTVSGARHLSWRGGMFSELIPVLGDGLLTTDGDYHDRARAIMMPAFHRRRMDSAVEAIVDETERSLASLPAGEVADVYDWARGLTTEIAMRALLGMDPHDGEAGREAAALFERALSFFGTPLPLMALRGPGSPWSRMQKARDRLDRLIYSEIDRRRAERAGGDDVLSMLLEARAEDGSQLSDRELRDQATTMLAAGHDTTSSTISFLLYELARNPDALERVVAELDSELGGQAPDLGRLADSLPELGMAVDETLRLYPPAWFGPRRAVEDFEFGGFEVPAGTHVAYSAWTSHRLPDVFEDPEEFRPERFTPEARAALPQGAYVPFGGGSRICIGKRFGLLVVKATAAMLLQRLRPELPAGHRLEIATVPNLSPKGGLPMLLHGRG